MPADREPKPGAPVFARRGSGKLLEQLAQFTGACALRNNVDAQRLEKPEDPGDVLYLIAGQSVNHQSRLSIADVADVFMPEGAENGEERV
jgi:hypothetical protein